MGVWLLEWKPCTDEDLERVCHRQFKANGAWMIPFACESCGVFHREKFWVEKVGGWNEVKEDVERLAQEMKDRRE